MIKTTNIDGAAGKVFRRALKTTKHVFVINNEFCIPETEQETKLCCAPKVASEIIRICEECAHYNEYQEATIRANSIHGNICETCKDEFYGPQVSSF